MDAPDSTDLSTLDYTTYLRGMIGNHPVNLLGAAALILNERGDLLLQRLAVRNIWSLPGGLCELGEPVLHTLKREVREETGLEVLEATLLDLIVTPHRRLPNGHEAYFYTAMYEVTAWQGTPVPDGTEGTALAFFSRETLPAVRGLAGQWATQWLQNRAVPTR